MYVFFAGIVFFLTLFSSNPGVFASSSEPKTFIENLGKEAVEHLTRPDAQIPDFIALLDKGFDVRKILIRIVTAAVWEDPTVLPLQEHLLELYKLSVARLYLNQFKRYGSKVKFEVIKSTPTGSGGALVESVLKTKNSPAGISIDWELNKETQWRIVDVRVEGVSLISDQTDVYRSILKGDPHNVPQLIKQLEAKKSFERGG